MHSMQSWRVVVLFLLTTLWLGCESDSLVRVEGALRVRVLNPSEAAYFVDVFIRSKDSERRSNASVERPETRVELSRVPTGTWDVYVATRDVDAQPEQSVQINNVLIQNQQVSEIVVDLAQNNTVRIPCTAGDPAIPLCMECVAGEVIPATDDARCGVLDCDAFAWWNLSGDNTPSGRSECIQGTPADVTTDRCVRATECKVAGRDVCPTEAAVRLQAGLCETITGCTDGAPVLVTAADGTPCGQAMECQAGQCEALTPDCIEGQTVTPVCTECQAGSVVPVTDDERCGAIACSAFESWTLTGDNSAIGTSRCIHGSTSPIRSDRCEAAGQCVTASATTCPTTQQIAATADLCKVIADCEVGTPAVTTVGDNTPCGAGRVCLSGVCTTIQPPETGCADGAREGFVSQADYPSIAGCAGAWSVPGITRDNLAPTCARAAGDDGSNVEGSGCSAVDLCAAGWHVCAGKDEVGRLAPAGCADAVPAGTPDKALLFAVRQHSTTGSECDASSNDNDVFGCGNLGTLLTADKNCAPLDRVLASTQANTCGFNEAEPDLGPWQCLGGSDSHLMEGGLVTKVGCPSTSCNYDGHPVGNSDKGGVLCCRD